LAAIKDITRKDGLTQIPVQMDGACNGSQHWSAIMGDQVTAKLTNVEPGEEPRDLYQYIADRVTDVCEGDEDNEWYQIFLDHWDHSIDRKVTKRPTMCDAYGLTFYGIQKYIKIEGHVDWLPADRKGAGIVELARAIQTGLDTTLVEPNKGKEYLKDICNIVSSVNQSVVYSVPSGFKVVHHYNKLRKRRSLASLFNHKELTFTSFTDEVDRKAAEQGIPPNFIHSLDASHMFCTIDRMILMGITSYSMIHDSYGCPAPMVPVMRELIKEEFYEMHRSNLLERFRIDVQEQLGVDLPPVPMRGAFNVSCVLESDYFFA
jgi:DNA-directed RNA polymerase